MIVVLLALAASPLGAQQGAGPQADATAGGVGQTQTRLTLRQAVAMAVSNNLDVRIERSSVGNAAHAVTEAQGAFDPLVQLRPVWESAATPVSSVLQAPDGRLVNRNWGNRISFVQPLWMSGTRFNVDFDNARVDTNNPFTVAAPYYTSRLVVGVRQPLLRGLRTDPARTELANRRHELSVAETDFRLRMTDVISQVEQMYWDLVASRQHVEVRQEAVALAVAQLERNRRLVEAGAMARVELSAAEAELERRRAELYVNVADVAAVENGLKGLLAADIRSAIWNDEIVPIDTRRPGEAPAGFDLPTLMSAALSDRLELHAIGQRAEMIAVHRRLADDQKRPNIDLLASYVNTGLAGALRPGDNPLVASNAAMYAQVNQLSQMAGLPPIAPPPAGIASELAGDYGRTMSNMFSGRYQTFQVALSVDLNLRNRTAEANLGRAEIAAARLALERRKLEQTIYQQVRDAAQTIQSARQRLAAAEASTRAAREKLESETRLFEAGDSTNFMVLTRQNELANSRLLAVVANVDLNRALARLERSVGGTLQNYGIQPDRGSLR
jgi:outer membrane protein TolC